MFKIIRNDSPPRRAPSPCQQFDADEALFCREVVRKQDAAIRCLIVRLKKLFHSLYGSTSAFSEDEVADVIQDTLALFFQHIRDDQYQCQNRKVLSYVGNIMKNMARGVWKRKKRTQNWEDLIAFQGTDESDDAPTGTPGFQLAQDAGPSDEELCSQRAIRRAFDELSQVQRDLMQAHYIDELTLVQYEQLKDLAPGYGRGLHFRAKATFVKLFKQYLDQCIHGGTL
jgi:DNA-directed RNA polymerase specialized sigma24 family protein